MSRQLRLFLFFLHQFLRVPVFLQTMIVSIIASVVVQYLAMRAWGGDPDIIVMRSTAIGMWTISTMAAGIINFERYKGTLAYILSSPLGEFRSLAGVVTAPSLSGLLAFPIAFLAFNVCSFIDGAGYFGMRIHAGILALSLLLLWLSCMVMSMVVAVIFVLTPNAITYEPLILTPVFLLSGIVFLNTSSPGIFSVLGNVFPLFHAVSFMQTAFHGNQAWHHLGLCVATSFIWLGVARWGGKRAIHHARRLGTLEVV